MQPTLNRKGVYKSDIAYVNKMDHDYDYGDIVVHVFQTPYRSFYRLEDLWADADREVYED